MFDDGAASMRFALTAFGGQVHLCGFVGDGVPVEVRCQPFARGDGHALGGVGVVEDDADSSGQAGDVAGREGHAGLSVDDRFTQAADVGGHQRDTRRRRFQGHDAERLVVAGQNGGVGGVEQADKLVVIEMADELRGLEHLALSGLLDEPLQLGAVTGDRQRRPGMACA